MRMNVPVLEKITVNQPEIETEATREFFGGMADGSIKLRVDFPLILPSANKNPCKVCEGRGLLKYPDGWIQNKKGKKIYYIEAQVLICPECRGAAVKRLEAVKA